MEIKKSTLYFVGIIVLIVVGGNFLLANGGSSLPTKEIVQGNGENVQEVTLSMKDYNYYPNTVTVKSGSPVRISLDNSVGGCFRDFTIREMGIHKYLQTANDYVEFTPTEPGRYTFACSMGMGTGTLVVE